MKVTEKQVLERMRKICLALDGTEEKVTHGHPSFATAKGIYAVLQEYKGDLSICVKVGKESQGVFLEDPRFYMTPYIGKHGWISLKVHAAPLQWKEIGELLRGSYLLTMPLRVKPRRSSPRGPAESGPSRSASSE